jgi:hypothetical protein
MECEKRGITSAPLARIATKWSGHWREHPGVKPALLNFEKGFEIEWVKDQLFESTQRLLRLTEPEVIAMQAGFEKLPETPRSASRPPEEPLGEPPATQRSTAAATRRRKLRGPAPKGWIYLGDAAEKYRVSRTTLQDWTIALGSNRTKDVESGQVRVREAALIEILKRRGRFSE